MTIYTDGACDPNPGPGGWAALLQFVAEESVLSGSESPSTNNRMELTAALMALESLDGPHRVRLFTDSEYLKKGITEWMPAWKARNWRRKKGKLANVELWQALDQAIRRHQIEWSWIRGHAGNRNNERVDGMAKRAIIK